MPLYEYRCAICGTQEEKLQSVSAATSHDCPECEATAGMQRQLSVAAFALTGGGWYKEGYSGGKEAPTKEGAKDAPAKEAPAEAGKPAEKPAPPPAVATETAPSKPAGGCGGGCACH
jgi:putative FmdB family regulatory protein